MLEWNWDKKCGEATFWQERDGEKHEYTLSLYKGNACLIMLYEYEEDGKEMYNMHSFWADKQHMKNCLGLNKKGGYTENIYEDGISHYTKFSINKARNPYWKDIVTALADGFKNITIEVYTEE